MCPVYVCFDAHCIQEFKANWSHHATTNPHMVYYTSSEYGMCSCTKPNSHSLSFQVIFFILSGSGSWRLNPFPALRTCYFMLWLLLLLYLCGKCKGLFRPPHLVFLFFLSWGNGTLEKRFINVSIMCPVKTTIEHFWNLGSSAVLVRVIPKR